METGDNVKELVKQKYSEIALQDKEINQSSCSGSGRCSAEVYNIMADDYTQLEGYNPEAGLGCGAGNDAFIVRHETEETGKVIGIDITPALIERAKTNAEKRGFNNVEFRQGDIEKMPVTANVADVVVSNCVLNLVPNKNDVLKEIYRVLKPGGRFSISDIVLEGELPKEIREAAEMYAGCVSGAIQKQVYLGLIEACGFKNITVQKDKPIIIPNDILSQYLSVEQLVAFKQSGTGIRSITVYAEKPSTEPKACCSSDCCN